MFGSTILDVAIGLIFIYFMLSLIASHANDLIGQWMGLRSKNLEAGMRKMLHDDSLAESVWNHPLIAGTGFKKPEYIPPGSFVVALMDAIVPPSEGGDAPVASVIRGQLAKMPESHVKNQLTHIVNTSNNNLVQTRAGIESWFNASMERVSTEYKKQMQLLTLLVALAISVVLGADTVSLANGLWREPVMRAALAGSAQQTGQTTPTLPTGASTNSQDTLKQLAQYNLPIGWNSLPQDIPGWILKVIGLAMTTVAVSLGAPFWFDLLRTLSNLRNSTVQSRTPSPAAPTPALPVTTEPAESDSKKTATP